MIGNSKFFLFFFLPQNLRKMTGERSREDLEVWFLLRPEERRREFWVKRMWDKIKIKENRGCGWETGRGSVYLEHGGVKNCYTGKADGPRLNTIVVQNLVKLLSVDKEEPSPTPQYRAGSRWEQDVLQRYESGNKDTQDCMGEAGKWSLPCSVWEVLRSWATRCPWKWASRCRSVRRKERHQVVVFIAWEGTGRGKT